MKDTENKKVKTITLGLVLQVIFGYAFLLLGLVVLFISFFAGIVLLIISIVLLPNFNAYFKYKFNFELSKNLKAFIIIFCLFLFVFFISEENNITNTNSFESNSYEVNYNDGGESIVEDNLTNDRDESIIEDTLANDIDEPIAENNIVMVQKIVEDYHNTHTYTESDFFVCADMAIDIWNLVKTKGINAKIHAGNVNEDISEIETYSEYLSAMNHAWVLAETTPFKWIALETTGGHLVWGEDVEGSYLIKNDLYYMGMSFNNPKEFKKFIEMRRDLLQVCYEAESLIDYWNENIVGEYLTSEISEFKGRMDAKTEECNALLNQLKGLVT